MSDHSHVAKIISWKFDEKFNQVPDKYGCTGCDKEFFEPPKSTISVEHKHTSYVEGCFSCKIDTIQWNTGDANSGAVANGWTEKRWNKELDLYKSARAQGIQPDGTSTAKIQKALDISDKTGVAYGS